jgi:hypothetical protein
MAMWVAAVTSRPQVSQVFIGKVVRFISTHGDQTREFDWLSRTGRDLKPGFFDGFDAREKRKRRLADIATSLCCVIFIAGDANSMTYPVVRTVDKIASLAGWLQDLTSLRLVTTTSSPHR